MVVILNRLLRFRNISNNGFWGKKRVRIYPYSNDEKELNDEQRATIDKMVEA